MTTGAVETTNSPMTTGSSDTTPAPSTMQPSVTMPTVPDGTSKPGYIIIDEQIS